MRGGVVIGGLRGDLLPCSLRRCSLGDGWRRAMLLYVDGGMLLWGRSRGSHDVSTVFETEGIPACRRGIPGLWLDRG